MKDFLRGDEASYDDFMQSISPAFSGTGATGIAIQGFASAGISFAAGDPVGGTIEALQTAVALIGRGRREADEITAVQTPVSALLEQVNTEMGVATITTARLIQLRDFVVAAGNQLQQVIARPWPDGRAAAQAKAVMFGNPGYLRVTIENIDKMIAERSGVGAQLTAAAESASSSPLILGAAAVAAWFLFR